MPPPRRAGCAAGAMGAAVELTALLLLRLAAKK